MNEFLNPKSMLTPGAAGAMVMLITNSICLQFPEVEPRWMAIFLSFILGAFVLSAANLTLRIRAGLWFLNSLIIFSVAAGTANVAANKPNPEPVPIIGSTSLLDIVVPAAFAQESLTSVSQQEDLATQPASIRELLAQQTEFIAVLQAENQQLREEISRRRGVTRSALQPPEEDNGQAELQRIEAEKAAVALAKQKAAEDAARVAKERAALQAIWQAEELQQRENAGRFFKNW